MIKEKLKFGRIPNYLIRGGAWVRGIHATLTRDGSGLTVETDYVQYGGNMAPPQKWSGYIQIPVTLPIAFVQGDGSVPIDRRFLKRVERQILDTIWEQVSPFMINEFFRLNANDPINAAPRDYTAPQGSESNPFRSIEGNKGAFL